MEEKRDVLILNMAVIPAPKLPSSRTFFIALPVVGSVGKFCPLGLNVSTYRIGVFVKVLNNSTNK